MARDYRSPEATAYRVLYSTKQWKQRRADQLAKQPLCERCLKSNFIVPAKVANHVIPHKGDLTLFFEGELQSLCTDCHDGPTQKQEVTGKAVAGTGYSTSVGVDGMPTDPRNPFYGR